VKFKESLLLGFSIVAVLLLMEAAARMLRSSIEPTGNQYVFYQFDPLLGWVNQPNVTGIYRRAEFSYPLVTNRHGMRYRDVNLVRSEGVYRVAVLGDSFTWGIGVADKDRFTERVETIFQGRVEMLNFGVSGYGPIQYLIQLPRILEFHPDAVLIAFCLGNDFQDNVFYRRYGYYKPYSALTDPIEIRGYPLQNAKLHESNLIYDNLALARMAYETLRKFTTPLDLNIQQGPRTFDEDGRDIYFEPSDEARRDAVARVAAVNAAILRDIKVALDLRGIKFAVVTAPTKCEYGHCFPDITKSPNLRAVNLLKRGADREGIHVIDSVGSITIDDFWSIDGHWRPTGHSKMADAIAQWMQNAWQKD
jgi:lysophospholipase L1-like esterase